MMALFIGISTMLIVYVENWVSIIDENNIIKIPFIKFIKYYKLDPDKYKLCEGYSVYNYSYTIYFHFISWICYWIFYIKYLIINKCDKNNEIKLDFYDTLQKDLSDLQKEKEIEKMIKKETKKLKKLTK